MERPQANGDEKVVDLLVCDACFLFAEGSSKAGDDTECETRYQKCYDEPTQHIKDKLESRTECTANPDR